VRFAGRLAYDGTAYLGFQKQTEDKPTIQRAVEAALAQVTAHTITVIGAGRTDTGVHAQGQVIAFDGMWQHPVENLQKAINLYLPFDIALQSLRIVPDDFHPRFDAISRTYLYRIYIASTRDPLRERYVWHRLLPLDYGAMQSALQRLIGEHDFATFGQPTQGEVTIRTVYEASLGRDGDEIHITIRANAFLQRMMRSIVGTLVEVGRGKMTVEDFEAALLAKDRGWSGQSAPPRGLTLTHVTYLDVDF
jgi:tRNA pseudouridine38-40 synthase